MRAEGVGFNGVRDAMKEKAIEEYVQIDDAEWAPFPEVFSEGGVRWRLLHISLEAGNVDGDIRVPCGIFLRFALPYRAWGIFSL
jgi:hypothetical protein